jgi:hypothetical protein
MLQGVYREITENFRDKRTDTSGDAVVSRCPGHNDRASCKKCAFAALNNALAPPGALPTKECAS